MCVVLPKGRGEISWDGSFHNSSRELSRLLPGVLTNQAKAGEESHGAMPAAFSPSLYRVWQSCAIRERAPSVPWREGGICIAEDGAVSDCARAGRERRKKEGGREEEREEIMMTRPAKKAESHPAEEKSHENRYSAIFCKSARLLYRIIRA